jgi:uncharacterized protein YabE (DUF348 family)
MPEHVAGAGRPSPKRRRIVYKSRPRGVQSDARAWVPFPNAKSSQTLGDLLDDGERAPAQKQPVAIREPRRAAPLGRRRRRQQRRRRQRRRLVFVALALLTVAAVALELPQLQRRPSQVTIRVNGKERVSTRTDASNVADALQAQHVKVHAGDRVRPRPSARVSDGMTVEVFRSFPVTVDLDGVVTPLKTTWATPARVLQQLRLDPDKVSIVTSPTRLTQGSSVAIRTLRRVTVSVDGTRHTETTPALSVGELLEQSRVTLGPDDELSPSADTGIADGMTVTVSRIVKEIETDDEPLPPPTVTQDDLAMAVGLQAVVQEGVPGNQRVVYQITKRDGHEIERTAISSEPIQPPTPKIIAIGRAPVSLPPG